MSEKNLSKTLEIKDLSIEFRTRNRTVYAVNHLDLEIKKGQTLGLVGETGAGKTTTGLAILDLISSPPGVITSGKIFVNGRCIIDSEKAQQKKGFLNRKKSVLASALTVKELQNYRGNEVSMIFQDPMTSLNPVLTVEEQIAEVIENHENIGMKDATERARKMLELVGISADRGKEYPHQFSGGMKQRVVIAMALACNPDLLIADEPTTALDVTIQAQVLELMRNLREQNGTSMLMITHDLGIVAEVCDAVSVIYAGTVVEHGSLEDIFEHTMHPYTKGLFNSLPNMNDRHARLKPIKGLMPDPSVIHEGCPFADRCDHATDRCFRERPKKYYRNQEHFVYCHLFDECLAEGSDDKGEGNR